MALVSKNETRGGDTGRRKCLTGWPWRRVTPPARGEEQGTGDKGKGRGEFSFAGRPYDFRN